MVDIYAGFRSGVALFAEGGCSVECGVDFEAGEAAPVVEDAFGFRTANLLMEGTAMIRC